MNKDLLFNPSKFITNRAQQLAEDFNEKVEDEQIQNQSDFLSEMFSTIRSFFQNMGKPTMQVRKIYDGTPPDSSVINDTFTEIYNDTSLIKDEETLLGDAFKQSFNYSTTEKIRMRNKVRYVGELANDYVVTANNTLSKCLIIQDSFTSLDKADIGDIGNAAHVDVANGVVTLKLAGSIDQVDGAEVLPITSNKKSAIASNFLVAYQKNSDDDKIQGALKGDFDDTEKWDLSYLKDPHGDPQAIIDQQPNTWYEHQLINFPEEKKSNPCQKLGLYWDDKVPIYDGKKGSDQLTVTIVIKLAEKKRINWIGLYPYLPDPKCYLVVNNIETSVNNAEYSTCLVDTGDKDSVIASDPGTIDKKDRMKFTGQGAWNFPAREVQFVRFTLTAEQPYTENIAHIYWIYHYVDVYKDKIGGWTVHTKKKEHNDRVEGANINRDKFLKQSLEYSKKAREGIITGTAVAFLTGIAAACPILGTLALIASAFFSSSVKREDEKVTQKLDIFTNGWRWCVGIRGIDIWSYQYDPSSVYMSQTFPINKAGKEFSLSVSEAIPEEFYGDNLAEKNKWIKYYLSFDDGATWNEISPLERQYVEGEEGFANKIIAVQDTESEIKVPTKTYVIQKEDVTTVKLMVEFSRPDDLAELTPSLYDYKIRIVPKETSDL